ncbi:lachesin-like isoform X2 [Tachypleus tridentatus]|uniref:lachesin-like isoform X2 n=1 Tax=Tachypleus tridentatus TaxID=6853 RepID=UPI003FD424D5
MRDRGQYMCQINTSPMKNQVGYIKVVVPPHIDETLTSKDIDVREGDNVSLLCSSTGSPEPEITWRREDGEPISLGSEKVLSVGGNYLNISKVSRMHMGAYLCIATNGIPPAVSKRIFLGINFSPMIWIPNQLIGAPLGTDVVLDCHLEAHPTSVTYWMRESGVIIISNQKYVSVDVSQENYKGQLRLTIRDLEPDDYEIPGPSNARGVLPAISEKLRNDLSDNSITDKSAPKENHGSKDTDDVIRPYQEDTEPENVNSSAPVHTYKLLHVLVLLVSFQPRLVPR